MPPHQPPGHRPPTDGRSFDVVAAVDPDADLHVPGQRRGWTRHRWVLPTIALGGVLGALARHGLEVAWATPDGGFPWATFVTNVTGCLLIGVLMVQVVEVGGAHPLLRPFLGVGVLGGYTTFSTYAVQTFLLVEHHPGTAAAYLLGTLVAAMAAVTAGVVAARAARRLARRAGRRHPRPQTRPTHRPEDTR
ncbi:CrcB family protein [Nocardioides guangzhouensis]|uniref:Fluoride-specific ion channel FluC n=1 Tax=Nocardioides guangzhouensis TaxID=2497878 RepID=A0A4Q4ZF47_9ACTN|nr:CrcB family protein [Nocardioides guangzhouensis]RYP86742.1 CrcB family protein [Nocardioides guangzhouensis]